MRAAVIIPAGGSGSRMGLASPKQFHQLLGVPILVRTLQAFDTIAEITAIIVAAPSQSVAFTKELCHTHNLSKVVAVVAGGTTRQDSVTAGLAAVPDDIDVIAVHDAARPLVSRNLIKKCLFAANQHGAALAAIPVKDTLKQASPDLIVTATVDRNSLWQAQTPQAARTADLRQAFAKASEDGFYGTDEASLLEHAGYPVSIVEGEERNIKITRPDDLRLAHALIMHENAPQHPPLLPRIGHGYDAHRLVEGRSLILGGVSIPHHLGLLGHSDADVLIHALCDAILGALAAGDIGHHFPDSDDRYKGISSLILLENVIGLAAKHAYTLGNADITVIAQSPKLAPYIAAMRENLAAACDTPVTEINIKATTTERMGFPGREEGIAAHAVVILQPRFTL